MTIGFEKVGEDKVKVIRTDESLDGSINTKISAPVFISAQITSYSQEKVQQQSIISGAQERINVLDEYIEDLKAL